LSYPGEIWFADSFDLLKRATSPNPKPEVVLCRRSNFEELKNDKNIHITIIGMLLKIILPNCIKIGP